MTEEKSRASGARPFGTTGLTVSAIGLGGGRIGGLDIGEADVDRLIGAALDAGVTLIDTARSYGLSEERLGRALAGRRERVVLSTKVGYGVLGVADWTGPCVELGVDAALRRLETDWIDIVHLHSCGLDILEAGEVVEALRGAVQAGKVRVAAYSGEGDALAWAVRSGVFGAIQCSVSVLDQAVIHGAVADAHARGMGVIAKRALGNAPWRFASPPAEADVAEAWHRFTALAALGIGHGGLGWPALFTRFAASAPGVSSVLIGTATPAHLLAAVESAAQGALAPEQTAALRDGFARAGADWHGRV